MTVVSPKVSILMPVRNEAVYLQAALDSIVCQTLPDWELIVVDDGSTDYTPDILARAAGNDQRIRVITRPGDGLVAALNKGLTHCTAPLLARMDGDDVSHPRRLERQVVFLENNLAIGLVACNFRHFPRKNLKQGMRSYESWQNGLSDHELIVQDCFVESPFVHPSIMMRRELIVRAGGYRDFDWPEDYDLWLRLVQMGVKFARLPETLFFWRDHPERATRVMHEYADTSFRSCKLHHLLSGYLADSKHVIIAGAAQEGRAWQRILVAAGIDVSAWIDVDKNRIGGTLHGAPVYGIDRLNSVDDKILVAIGVHGARKQFRTLAARTGLKEGLDFICVS